MVQGRIEVLLVGAKGLENTDYLCNMDPYAILKFCSQEQKSSIASGKGSEPEWNENFVFRVSSNVSDFTIKLMDSDSGTNDDFVSDFTIKLMDSDSGTNDDFVGEATISLEALFAEGSLPPTVYNVVKEQAYCGEIKVGFTFTPEENSQQNNNEENFGGWQESS